MCAVSDGKSSFASIESCLLLLKGRVTSAYRIRDGRWTEIGRMSPQQPQMFYQVSHSGMSIQEGDIIAARCTMNSVSRTENTIIGQVVLLL